MQPVSANFEFLKAHGLQLFRLTALAEHYFPTDPNTSLMKLRQFAEQLARDVAARTGTLRSTDVKFAEVLGELGRSGYAPPLTLTLFHQLRVVGNDAVHGDLDDFTVALNALKNARQLAIWFVRSYGGVPKLAPGPFEPPRSPADPTAELRAQLEALRNEVDAQRSAAEVAQVRAASLVNENRAAAEKLELQTEERRVWQLLAEEAEAAIEAVKANLEAVQRQAAKTPTVELAKLEAAAAAADSAIVLDEAATRAVIDQQLRNAGWEADTAALRFSKGARPTKGRNLAIAEWPTETGPADYALFVGLTLVGVVEAKRQNANVMGVLRQAERYAAGIRVEPELLADGAPWGSHRAPFAFSTNGRPYLRQLESASGIWRRDLRRDTNPAGALTGWPAPQGLLDRLEIDQAAAEAALATQGFEFGFPLRPYQRKAIEAVEKGLAENRTSMLVGMATGTILDELVSSGCHWALAYPADRRPRNVKDGSEMFIGRLTYDPADIVIFGRATGMRLVEGRDDATTAEIAVRGWKSTWPLYVRVHHAEFVAGTLRNGVSMNRLMDALGSDAFASTQRNAAAGRGNVFPRASYRRQPSVRLSAQGQAWLTAELDTAMRLRGRVSNEELALLDWPQVSGFAATLAPAP